MSPEDPVVQHQAEARRQALAADRRQQVQNEKTVTYSKEMGALAEKQLAVQESMRDYLKEIAGNIAATKKGTNNKSGSGSDTEKPTNDTSKKTNPPQSRKPSSSELPINLRE
jgi:hypothetical protein